MREGFSSRSNVKVKSLRPIRDLRFILETISPYPQVCYIFLEFSNPIRTGVVYSHDNQLNLHLRPDKVPQSERPSPSDHNLSTHQATSCHGVRPSCCTM